MDSEDHQRRVLYRAMTEAVNTDCPNCRGTTVLNGKGEWRCIATCGFYLTAIEIEEIAAWKTYGRVNVNQILLEWRAQ